MAASIQTVVFDIGGVLLDWNPKYLYGKLIPDAAARKRFLTEICSFAWHENHDAGVSFADNAAPLLAKYSDPDTQSWIKAWDTRFFEMFRGPMQGAVDILAQLDKDGVELFALTNWPSGKFPESARRFPFLKIFKDVIVSSDEKLKKPDPAIYDVLVKRTGLDPNKSLYLDDRAENLVPAKNLGFATHHFANPENLAADLRRLGLLDQRLAS